MTIVYAVTVIVCGALTALWMIQRHTRLLQAAEYRSKEAIAQAEATKEMFAAEERKAIKQADVLGQAEMEVARKATAEVNYHTEQAKLARSVMEAFGSYRGDKLMEGHQLTVDGLLEAVRRQLDGEKASPATLPSKGRERAA